MAPSACDNFVARMNAHPMRSSSHVIIQNIHCYQLIDAHRFDISLASARANLGAVHSAGIFLSNQKMSGEGKGEDGDRPLCNGMYALTALHVM